MQMVGQVLRSPPLLQQSSDKLGPCRDPQRKASASGRRTLVPPLPHKTNQRKKTSQTRLLLRRPKYVLDSVQKTEVWEKFEAPN